MPGACGVVRRAFPASQILLTFTANPGWRVLRSNVIVVSMVPWSLDWSVTVIHCSVYIPVV